VTYQGKYDFNLPTATNTTIIQSDAYWVHNAYLAYNFTDKISAQLNVKNFADKLYYTRVRNNGWATPGDARSAVLTLSVGF
jgi:catecholate siderophore receptor